MSIKLIKDRNGYTVTVRTDVVLHGFKAGDIITSHKTDSLWCDERVVIEGVDSSESLWGTIIGDSGSTWSAHDGGDYVLLERPGLAFKVGDAVMVDLSGETDANRDVKTKAIIVAINPYEKYCPYLIQDLASRISGHNGNSNRHASWFPKGLTIEQRDLWWCKESMLTLVKSFRESDIKKSRTQEELANRAASQEVLEMNGQMPEWAQELIINYKAGNNCFILHGNIHDVCKNDSGKLLSLHQFLAETFESRSVIFYSLSQGIQFADDDAEKKFREIIRGNDQKKSDVRPSQAVAKAKEQFSQAVSESPIDQMVGGKSPDVVFPLFSKILIDGQEKKVLVIDNCHNIAPHNQSYGMAERAIVETLELWGRNSKIKDAGNMVILLSSFDASLADCLRALHSGFKSIKIPKPDQIQRVRHWETLIAENGIDLEEGVDGELLGRITNGLSLRDIQQICSLTKVRQICLSVAAVKERKRDILKNEFGDLIKIKDPEYGFKYFGGKENAKEHMMEIRSNILKGVVRRVPMGLLASGPPGTGKTFFFECWAYECGFNFVHIENPRNMWVGKSEENMMKIFAALDDIAPVVVIEDEADQSESPRDMPNGDSGVSGRLRKMKFEFCSDPARRGKVIWVRISNRTDLIDIAYKRKGRTDDSIPFILPEKDEYENIFKVMFARYGIPTDIVDFSEYANEVERKIYCSGADIEWMVREADQYAGRENKDKVESEHLLKAIADWEMATDPLEIDRQTVQAIRGSSQRLRPKNWENVVKAAENRLGITNESSFIPGASSIHPDFSLGKVGF